MTVQKLKLIGGAIVDPPESIEEITELTAKGALWISVEMPDPPPASDPAPPPPGDPVKPKKGAKE